VTRQLQMQQLGGQFSRRPTQSLGQLLQRGPLAQGGQQSLIRHARG
jgi:hypothetical protein